MIQSDHVKQPNTSCMNTTHLAIPTGLDIQNITKSFGQGAVALNKTAFTVAPGEMVALIGASGSGKSTLLRHVSGFLAADAGSGSIRVGPHTVQTNGRVHGDIRKMRSDIGFIFQQFNLVGRMNVLTNVLTGMLPRVPLWRSLLGQFTLAEKQEAYEALRMIGIEGLAYQRASTLSGGQQQRVAVARALGGSPSMLLADEPTGNLDSQNGEAVMTLLEELHAGGATICMVTHDPRFARCAERSIRLFDGRIVEENAMATATAAS